jgi:NAD(P)-dependent dehydrogenase (short-subunit alcohol dehydrogenase family)
MNAKYDFSDRCGIITGAASGIGRAAALLAAEAGAGLILVDRDKKPLLEAADQAAVKTTRECAAVHADVSQEADVSRMVEEAMTRFGRIDFLVTSAGVLFRTPFTDITLDEWDELMAVNVRGLFMCNQMVVRRMLEQGGGAVVNIASVAGRSISLIGGAHYCTSKHAVVGLTRHLARELSPRGIRANAFCPGATHTPMIHDNMDEAEVEGLKQRIVLGRLAEPEEQARLILFLVSDDASYLNGACLDSNGGSVML